MNRERIYRPRMRRTSKTCERCGAKKPGDQLYIRVDGNNASITQNSKQLCRSCYVAVWGPPT